MAVSSSPILSPFRMKITATEFVSPSSTLPRINFCNNRRQSPAVVLASKSEKESWSEAKRVLMEQYGFNPDEALSPEPSPNGKRKKKLKESGRGVEITPKEPKAARTTHKLLTVLGGKARRMKLLSPKGMDVRPMMEVVKGAAFDILQAAGGCPASLRPGRWLDLYSGTGSVGIEAISRGCSEVHFVEMDPWVVSDVLRPNLEWTGFLDMSVIHTVRVEKFMERAQKLAGKEPFDYISVTPPYMEVDYAVLMDQISSSDLVGEDTFIVVEYPLRTDMLDSCGCLVKITDRRFGRTHLAIYGPKWAQKKKKKEKSLRGAAVEI
ncbi:putative rRNA methyltransferase YlbH isoform X1 [Pyrus x bretschneideri]|uniref:putative rRNA methyltransferase YlbH isoform X1 n=1 Tax=Pyrus x bretschneideri TaxID=225117 RepID=UPI00202FE337|nr:putative rRNA methyltransferase YlbH isoform X1 [Pyrus x bretschneideri]XP_048433863.1 putative rRNA methyltransferase YlbH isoform X1 [Pyrus x bretschneideri]